MGPISWNSSSIVVAAICCVPLTVSWLGNFMRTVSPGDISFKGLACRS